MKGCYSRIRYIRYWPRSTAKGTEAVVANRAKAEVILGVPENGAIDPYPTLRIGGLYFILEDKWRGRFGAEIANTISAGGPLDAEPNRESFRT